MNRIAFLGTPTLAVATLEELAGTTEVALVVTQPDRPRGRSSDPMPSPVKERALELGLPVAQPDTARALLECLLDVQPLDVGVVVAYGRLLSPEVFNLPASGMLNVHFSLLPRWRGAAPVNRAVMAGDSMSGVTLIQIDDGLDTGPVLTAQAVDVSPQENAGELTQRLASLGARLMAGNLGRFVDGEIRPVPQSSEGMTYAAKIGPEDRLLGTRLGARGFINHVRGLAPSPGATLEIDGRRHKILGAAPTDEKVAPGTWEVKDGWPIVGLENGAVRLVRLQAPGRKVMAGDEWARGMPTAAGLTV